jgi:hypothetical protein
MNKLNVGEYVRTNYGLIGKIIDKYKGVQGEIIYKADVPSCDGDFDYTNIFKFEIIKTSPRIIDLIEVGDYVNGFYVIDKPFNQRIHTEFDDFFEEDIESVVTKESFENISYKVGDK